MTEKKVEFITYKIDKPLLGGAFLVQVPSDWGQVPMTDDNIDFKSSDLFQPLAIFLPLKVPSALTVMARPKFSEGTLDEWIVRLCKGQNITIKQQGQTTLGTAPVALVMGTQTTEAGLFGLYIALFEDGGILYALVIMAPESLWDEMSPVMEQIALGFRLLDPKGTTMQPTAPNTNSSSSNVEKHPKKEFSYSDFALADSPESFSPENEFNIIDDKLGKKQVPSVYEVNTEDKNALISFSSIDGLLNVPFGWNINDDGIKGKIFNLESGRIIEISFLKEVTDINASYESSLNELKQKHPKIEYTLLETEGGEVMAIRGMQWKGKKFEKVIIYRDLQRFEPGLVKFEITSAPEDIEQLLNLALLMLKDIRVG